MRLRIQREKISPTFVENDRNTIRDIAVLVGEALTRAAAALPESILREAPLLENIGLYRPALTGVDIGLYNSLSRRQRLSVSIREQQRANLQEKDQK